MRLRVKGVCDACVPARAVGKSRPASVWDWTHELQGDAVRSPLTWAWASVPAPAGEAWACPSCRSPHGPCQPRSLIRSLLPGRQQTLKESSEERGLAVEEGSRSQSEKGDSTCLERKRSGTKISRLVLFEGCSRRDVEERMVMGRRNWRWLVELYKVERCEQRGEVSQGVGSVLFGRGQRLDWVTRCAQVRPSFVRWEGLCKQQGGGPRGWADGSLGRKILCDGRGRGVRYGAWLVGLGV